MSRAHQPRPATGNIKYALSGDDTFIASVEPGETFVVECAINANDGTIRHLGQQLTEADVTIPFVNGATGPIEVRGSKAGDMLKPRDRQHGARQARLHRAVAGHRHVSRLGPAQGVRHPDPRGRGQGRPRALERASQAADQADDRRARRCAGPRRGSHRRQRPAWRQYGRPGDHHRQHRHVPRQQGRRASVHGRLPCHPGRRRMQRNGRDRDRGDLTVKVSLDKGAARG